MMTQAEAVQALRQRADQAEAVEHERHQRARLAGRRVDLALLSLIVARDEAGIADALAAAEAAVAEVERLAGVAP